MWAVFCRRCGVPMPLQLLTGSKLSMSQALPKVSSLCCVLKLLADIAADAFETRVPFAYPKVTLRPMEVRTFLASFE